MVKKRMEREQIPEDGESTPISDETKIELLQLEALVIAIQANSIIT